ncbi:MAG: DUF3179 domain-containing (seleno)protein [Thermoplasmatota archaeon]
MRLLALILLVAAPVHATHVDDIAWACGYGGQGRDGHPDDCGIDPVGGDGVGSIGQPAWGDSWIDGSDMVLGVVVDDTAVAVPVRMLDRHEIANVDVAGVPIAITYCPLCGSGVTFARQAMIDGQAHTLSFAASGFLHRHDLVMWDAQTDTLWTQILGEPIATLREGRAELDHHDTRLDVIPTALASWDAWREEHPTSLMLQPAEASYGNAYPGYDASCRYGISGQSDCDVEGLHPKEWVLGIRGPRGEVAVPRFAIDGVHVLAQHGVVVAQDGPAFRAFDVGRHTFSLENRTWFDEAQNPWNLTTGMRQDGAASLEPLESLTMYWFAWQTHHPETSLWLPADAKGALGLHDNGQLPGFTIGIVAMILVAAAFLLRRR